MTTENAKRLDVLMSEAAAWYARMDCGTADQADFELWRDADPRHAAAFARLVGTSERVRQVKVPVRRSLEAAANSNLSTSRRGFMAAALGALGVVTVVCGATYMLISCQVSANTAVGDHEIRRLPDGGQLDLNTNTKVRWRFDRNERSVWLDQGEVALDIPTDRRPLCLFAAGKRILVTAGKLNARLRGDAVDLLMLQGTCVVTDQMPFVSLAGAPTKPVKVGAGQAVLADGSNARVRTMAPTDIQFVSSWQSGELVFNGETLGAAIEEYNRYLLRKISIGDPSLQGIKLGGRFNSRDPAEFLSALHSAFNVTVARADDGSVILTR